MTLIERAAGKGHKDDNDDDDDDEEDEEDDEQMKTRERPAQLLRLVRQGKTLS